MDSEAALTIIGIPYVCRVCTHPTTVHVQVEMTPDGPEVDLSDKRLWEGHCEECDQERPFVARPAEAAP